MYMSLQASQINFEIPYSVIIHICGKGGFWDQAEELFNQQLKAAETDINCQPNAISYWSVHTLKLHDLHLSKQQM